MRFYRHPAGNYSRRPINYLLAGLPTFLRIVRVRPAAENYRGGFGVLSQQSKKQKYQVASVVLFEGEIRSVPTNYQGQISSCKSRPAIRENHRVTAQRTAALSRRKLSICIFLIRPKFAK